MKSMVQIIPKETGVKQKKRLSVVFMSPSQNTQLLLSKLNLKVVLLKGRDRYVL